MTAKRFSFCLLPILILSGCLPQETGNINWIETRFGSVSLTLPEVFAEEIGPSHALVRHRVPLKHEDECNYVENITRYYLTDLEWAIEISEGTLADTVERMRPSLKEYLIDQNSFQIQKDFIDPIIINSQDGFRVTVEHDGCGMRIYFVPLEKNVLLIHRSSGELGTTSLVVDEWKKARGVIQRETENELFEHFLSSIKFTQ